MKKWVLLLALALCACQPVSTAGLDDAMQAYLDAIHDKNPAIVMRYIPREDKWHYISYHTENSEIDSAPFFTYAQTQEAFDKHSGLWFALFSGTSDYSYADRVAAHPLSTWIREPNELTYRIPAKDGISYVTWRKENGAWVISAIGDAAP